MSKGLRFAFIVVMVFSVQGVLQTHQAHAQEFSDAGFYASASDLSPSAQAGRDIWYKATAGNGRFHTYVFQQRLGVFIDWYRVLRSDRRDERFEVWGLVNNPGCCKPGSQGCPAKSYEETYGFDWCAGDDELLKYVGKEGYKDPACDMQYGDAPWEAFQTPHDPSKRQSACDLEFGTSTGAMGLRKFPNPRFDADAWRKLNERVLNEPLLGSWEGYNALFTRAPDVPEIDAFGYEVRQLGDGSVEPPFYIGMACGACHIAFDPQNPPADVDNPEWGNLLGLIGNQYTRMSEIMASGMPEYSLEWQMFSHSRPGTVDTSAVPNDQVNNPGTMNALINISQRPANHAHEIKKWRPATSCPDGAENCWCDPAAEGKCWQQGTETENIHNILKGGGDSIGMLEALQRVYINIGSCAEACWVNHLTDLRQLDPNQRGFGQTPFDIGQCRRDCPNFRAIEDRLGNIADFVLSSKAHSTPLFAARGLRDRDVLAGQLEAEFNTSVARGKQIFADNCARCHSFTPGQNDPGTNMTASAQSFLNSDPFAPDPENGVSADWLGNDEPTPVSEVGTYHCRALHSNHMEGHIWQEYASETYRARAQQTNLGSREDGPGDAGDGGRGYYRNLSLVDLWAHAPFMHNNAIGPEVCGAPEETRWNGRLVDFYNSPYVEYDDRNGNGRLDDDEPFWRDRSPPACWPYDPSVEGRFELFKASVDLLLNPDKRQPKVTMLNEPIVLDIGPKVHSHDADNPLRLLNIRLAVPQDTSAGMFGSLQHKKLFRAMLWSKLDKDRLRARLKEGPRPNQVEQDADMLEDLTDKILRSPGQVYDITREVGDAVLQLFSTCRAKAENNGHEFGASLSDADKKALTAFLATL